MLNERPSQSARRRWGTCLGQSSPGQSRKQCLDNVRPHGQVGVRNRVEGLKAAGSIRYTSDSHGHGVHEGHLYRMSPFSGLERVATNIPANILSLPECPLPALGDSHSSVGCSECLARIGSSSSCLSDFAWLRLCSQIHCCSQLHLRAA
jgi:hypothetical protein